MVLTSVKNEVIKMAVDDWNGTAKIEWIADGWGAPHYGAFISTPFQDSKWVNLSVYNREDKEEAIAKARMYLKLALMRCMHF